MGRPRKHRYPSEGAEWREGKGVREGAGGLAGADPGNVCRVGHKRPHTEDPEGWDKGEVGKKEYLTASGKALGNELSPLSNPDRLVVKDAPEETQGFLNPARRDDPVAGYNEMMRLQNKARLEYDHEARHIYHEYAKILAEGATDLNDRDTFASLYVLGLQKTWKMSEKRQWLDSLAKVLGHQEVRHRLIQESAPIEQRIAEAEAQIRVLEEDGDAGQEA